MKKWVWLGILAIIIVIVVVTIQKSRGPGEYDDFAKCLTEEGMTMYGAYWCPHCATQKEMFGKSWKHVDYVECSLPNKGGQTEVCKQAGIKSYPTWELANGTRETGSIPLKKLGEYAGCEI